jgi:hypothetical protein
MGSAWSVWGAERRAEQEMRLRQRAKSVERKAWRWMTIAGVGRKPSQVEDTPAQREVYYSSMPYTDDPRLSL